MGAEHYRDPPVGQSLRGHQATLCPDGFAVSGIETIRWVLVPLIPNADTAAVRHPSTACHGVSLSASRNPCLSQSISRLGSSTCRVGGTARVFGGQDGLGQTQRARRGLRMPDVGLDRSQQRSAAGRCSAVTGRQRQQFGAVTEPGPGAVPFDHPDIDGLNPGLRDGATEQVAAGRRRWAPSDRCCARRS